MFDSEKKMFLSRLWDVLALRINCEIIKKYSRKKEVSVK